ncbi:MULTISPECIES: glycosyltransferase 61 family protein [Aphanothece]|uniref:glycosyltransferase 61 family protein n=1 Tax=Aphanothece TaxID=1121 RepID=UPI00398522C5
MEPDLKLIREANRRHPSWWGKASVTEPSSIIVESDALVLDINRVHETHRRWWIELNHGVVDRHGQLIEALNDKRGDRHFFYPPTERLAALRNRSVDSTEEISKDFVLYGGTLFDHFGHLLLDLTRTYQLLRLFRDLDCPIWFHYHRLRKGGTIANRELIVAWLTCLGIHERTRLVRRPIRAKTLVSSSVLYRDRCFVTRDFHDACLTALRPELRANLEATHRKQKIAYLSRHKLITGTTKFLGELDVVNQISGLPNVDIICPEELSFEEKLALYRSYDWIIGFPQACMNLKAFVPSTPGNTPARQVMFLAGPKTLSTNWVNIDAACGFDDLYVDCHPQQDAGQHNTDDGFQRSNSFDVQTVVNTVRRLSAQG